MEKGNIRKNYIYNLISQTITIIIPLITTPYLSRVLGASKIGEISFTQSIISYLQLFASLGSGIYAVRQIAYYQDDKEKQSEIFCRVIVFRIIMSSIIFLVYGFLIWNYKTYTLLLLLESTYLLTNMLDINWYFNGNENFKITVFRGLAIKIVGTISIFLCINRKEDAYLYVFLLGLINLLGTLSLWFPAIKKTTFILPSIRELKKCFKESILLFLPQVAGSLYLYCDKLLIGLLSSDIANNGYYEQSQKIVRLSITIITALPTVMLPRISNAFKNGDEKQIAVFMQKSVDFVCFLGLPMSLGLVAVAKNFVPWFFGNDFYPVIELLMIMAPIVFFNSIYNIIGYQYLLAIKKENVLTITVIIGGIINIVLNILLIPRWGAVGASFSSVIAEIIVAIEQIIYLKTKMKSIKFLNKQNIKVLICSMIMFFVLIIISNFVYSSWYCTFALLFIGLMIYMVLSYIFKIKIIKLILKYK